MAQACRAHGRPGKPARPAVVENWATGIAEPRHREMRVERKHSVNQTKKPQSLSEQSNPAPERRSIRWAPGRHLFMVLRSKVTISADSSFITWSVLESGENKGKPLPLSLGLIQVGENLFGRDVDHRYLRPVSRRPRRPSGEAATRPAPFTRG